MEKQKSRKKIKGLSLISLTIAVVILIIISSLLIYNAKNGVKIRAYKMLQNDIQMLDDKINSYYAKYSAIPAEIEYKNTTLLDRMFNETEKSPNDGEEYYVIDLKALDGVTLNYGKDYENITSEEDTRKYDDVYVINKDSHHIYYVRGIELDGKWKYTNENDDEVEILVKKKWKMATEKYSDGGDVAYAIDSRGELYIVPMGYKGKINENKDYAIETFGKAVSLINKKIVGIAGGMNLTVILDGAGNVYTCGTNQFGQLGRGTETYSEGLICISEGENAIKGKKIVKVVAGDMHVVAIDEDGKVYTWGYNSDGQLGDGTTTNSAEPICISDKENAINGKKIVEIEAKGFNTVALDENGKVYTWGYNEYGQLGDGTSTPSAEPICVSDKENIIKGKKIVKIACGAMHMIVTDGSGKVYTWGNNEYGQLGDGTVDDSNVPICISDKENIIKGKKITEIATGYLYTVAIDKNGKVYTWGNNEYGQLGDGTTTDSMEPICISGKENVIKDKKIVKVAAGGMHTAVVDKDGKKYIWGNNESGQLGDGTVDDSNVPICISENENSIKGEKIVKIACGIMHTIAIDENDKVYTWGSNGYEELGEGTTTKRYYPICINKENIIKGKKIVEIDGGVHTVAIDEDGKVYTWGYNSDGQLGDGTMIYSDEPICISEKENVLKDKKIERIEAGVVHTVALDKNGKVYTWGSNNFDQLGNGTVDDSKVPICISDQENAIKGKKIVGITAGDFYTVAIDENGKVYTWGYNYYGQLGDGTENNSVVPICISDKENAIKGKKIVKVAAGENHTVAIDEDGKVYTWGENFYGQLGDGTSTSSVNPICISDKENAIRGKKIVKVAAGVDHTVAIDENGKVYTWGNNFYRQLGNGTREDGKVPICISETENEIKDKKVVDIMAGTYYTVVLDDDGYMCIYGCGKGKGE